MSTMRRTVLDSIVILVAIGIAWLTLLVIRHTEGKGSAALFAFGIVCVLQLGQWWGLKRAMLTCPRVNSAVRGLDNP